MKRRLIVPSILFVISCLIFSAVPVLAGAARENMPPLEEGIAKLLVRQGQLAPDATEEQVREAVKQYVNLKLGQKSEDRSNPLAARELAAREKGQNGKWFHGKKQVHDAKAVPGIPNPALDNILVLLVEFTDPTHGQMPEPNPATDNTSYWVPNFDQAHYTEMLFSREPGVKSMANYFLEQSYGKYTVSGEAFGWVQVPYPESWYGADRATGGQDNLNGPVWRVVQDAVAAAGNTIDWAKYDTEDPYDFDGDGIFEEPDGYVDHIMLIHAGADQSAGGGAQGNDAIWAHSWWVDQRYGVGPGLGGAQTANPDVWVGPYTIMPEDGGIGVFCHEFAHDLGLPDEYDTIYSGESSPAFWSLMASGSWLGRPLGTEPSDISIWGRNALGWLDKKDIVTLNTNSKPTRVNLDAVELKTNKPRAIRYNLPVKEIVREINSPFSGVNEWYSGSGDDLNNIVSRSFDLSGVTSATLSFMTWYDIEEGYDYGFTEVSTDGGSTWVVVPGNLTENFLPNGEPTFGITGTSADWVQATYDLSAFAGANIQLRFRYYTDGGVAQAGWAIDDISIPEIGFSDDVENGDNGWTTTTWKRFGGTSVSQAQHYYIAEWRTYSGFDNGLQAAYSYPLAGGDWAEWYAYDPGLLLWYRDMEYSDNWVGAHPGHGFLLVVDSHPEPLRDAWNRTLRNRIQAADAAFGLLPTTGSKLTMYKAGVGQTVEYPPLPGVALFDDSISYWSAAKPDNSVIVPTYGVQFKVLQQSSDGTAAMIEVLKK